MIRGNRMVRSFVKPCFWCGAEMQSYYGMYEKLYCSEECKRAMARLQAMLKTKGIALDFRHCHTETTGNLRGVLERMLK